MATNFNTNVDSRSRALSLERSIPLDVRTVVETFNDISSIPNPFVGMLIYVKDEEMWYLVKKVNTTTTATGKEKIIIDINSLIKLATSDNITSLLNEEDFKGDKGDKGDTGDKGDSIVWKGELIDYPENPENGWAFYHTELGITFIYWDGWYKMSQDGEQGPQGEGAKVAIKGSFDSLTLMSEEWATYYNNPDGYTSEQYNSFITPLEPGDGYIVEENGHLYVFFTSVKEFDNAWTDAGPIKGEDGDSAYLYIAYSNNPNGEGCWSIETNPNPGTYIGIKTSTEKLTDLEYTDYVWTLWQGDDGWGYEQVFLLTSKDSGYDELNGPNIANYSSEAEADYRPFHGLGTAAKGHDDAANKWADRPLPVSEEWPLCWVMTRKAGKEYTPWKGTVDNKAILYSRWSKDGVDGEDGKDGSDGQDAIYLELSNDQAIIPFENGTVDTDFTDPVTTQMTLYKGHNPVPEDEVTYSIDNTTAASCTPSGKVTLNLNNLSGVSVITCIATYNEKPYKKNFYIVKTSNAYEIVPSHSILVRTDGKITSPSTLTAEVKKWDDTNWSNESNKVLFVQYFYLDGSSEVKSIANSNLARTIDITKENLISIRLYVTADNDEDGAVLSYESIGVIADGDNGKDGSTYKTAYAFRRTNDDLSLVTPTGGSWVNPVPTDWSDSIPEGDQTLWMTLREFQFGNDTYGKWSTPRQMTDSNNFQVEFSKSETKPTPQSLQSFYDTDPTNYEENWRASEKSAGREWIDHDEDASNAIWMATALFHNGVWDDWSVVKIKGEKGNPGEKGADGTSVTILGSLGDVSELDGVYEESLTKGAGYLINGNLWVFQGTNQPNEGDYYKDETHGVYWLNVGEIQGPAGVSAHLYVRCSNTEGDKKELLDENKTGKYIGYLVSSEILTSAQLQEQSNLGNFTWTKWSGQDGWGYEQIYILSDSTYAYDKGPDVDDLESSATPDYRPTISDTEHCKGVDGKWSDTPMVPTAEYPYCWEAIRKVSGDGEGTVYGEWKGVVVDNRMCARLFDRYITDGKDSVYLELSNEFASAIVDDNGAVQNTVTIDRILYKGGGEIPDNEVKYGYESNAAFSVTENGSEITVTTLNAEEVIIVCTAEYNEKTYKKKAVVRKSDTAWRVSSDTHVINKYYKDNELVISTGVVNFFVEKWDSSKWIDASKNVYLSYSLNGVLSTKTITNKSFDFRTLDGDANNFKIYITEDNTSGGTPLDYEKLGIVIDGKDGINGGDGDPGSDAYNFELTNDFGIVPLESNGDIDTQASAVQTSLLLIKGTTVLTKEDGVTYSSVPVADGSKISLDENGLLTIRPAQYTEASDIPTEITCTAKHGDVTLSKVFKIRTAQNAYELIVPKHMLERDLTTGLLVEEDQEITVQVQKWNSVTNIWENPALSQSLYVVVDCVHLGNTTDHSQAKVVSNGTATIILDKQDLKSVRLYLSKSNNVTEARSNYFTYEDLGVYANGEDGYSQEYLYILSKQESKPINPTPSGYVKIESYQNNEWTPTKHFNWEGITTGQYTSTDGTGKYIKEDMDPAWTDEPTGISTEYPYEYVSVRKKVNGIWGQFSTPTLWSAYGQKGDPGSDTVVAHLTNPSSIIMIVNGAFAQTTTSTGLQVRKGSEFVQVTSVAIDKGWLDGVEKDSPTYYLASITPELDTTSEYSDNNLVFTIKINLLEVKPQVIKLRLKIVTTEGTFYEDKTINILESGKSGENAIHLELTEDVANVTIQDWNEHNGQLGITTTAILYDGSTASPSGTVYSAVFTGCNGTCDSATGIITVDSVNREISSSPKVEITAEYNGITRQKTFVLNNSVFDWKLSLKQNVINIDNPTAIVGELYVDGKLWPTLTEGLAIKYSIDGGAYSTVTYSNSQFVIDEATIRTVTENLIVELQHISDGKTYVYDRESVGVVKNGESTSGLDILNNHSIAILNNSGTIASVGTGIRAYHGTSNCDIDSLTLQWGETTLEENVDYTWGKPSSGSDYYNILINSSAFEKLDRENELPWYINTQVIAEYSYNGTSYEKETTWTIVVNSSHLPYLILSPSSINWDNTDDKTITIKCFDPGNGSLDYSGWSNEGWNVYVDDEVLASDTYTISEVKDVNVHLEIDGCTVDRETIPVLKNGADADYWEIDVNHHWIVKDKDGNIISPVKEDGSVEAIQPRFIHRTETTSISPFIPPLHQVYVSIDGVFNENSLTTSQLTILKTTMENTEHSIIYYLFPSTVTPTSTSIEGWIDYVEVNITKEVQGPPGDKGESGASPVIYPAGEFNASKLGEYVGTAQKAPYVYVKGDTANEYYIAFGTPDSAPDSSTAIDSDESLDWNDPTDKWVKMQSYSAIYSDIGVFDHALVGQWVFHGKYMFSQDGKIGSIDYEFGDYTVGDDISYEKIITEFQSDTLSYIIEDDGWVPNICLNAVTGEVVSNKMTLKEGCKIGDFNITTDGLEYTTDGGNVKIVKSGLWVEEGDYCFNTGMSCDNVGAVVSVGGVGQLCPTIPTALMVGAPSGNVALHLVGGTVRGLKTATKVISTTPYDLRDWYSSYLIKDLSSCTVNLPTGEDGMEFVIDSTGASIIIKGTNIFNLNDKANNLTSSTVTYEANRMTIRLKYYGDASMWISSATIY